MISYISIVLFLLSVASTITYASDNLESFYDRMDVTRIDKEFTEGSTIYGFDVSTTGECLIMTSYNHTWYINVYTRTGIFQFCIRFYSQGDVCQAFFDDLDRISILFFKAHIIVCINSDGGFVDSYLDKNLEVEHSLTSFDADGISAVYEKTVSGNIYTLSIPGLFERIFRNEIQTLTIENSSRASKLVYSSATEANQNDIHSFLYVVILFISVTIILIILKKKGVMGKSLFGK